MTTTKRIAFWFWLTAMIGISIYNVWDGGDFGWIALGALAGYWARRKEVRIEQDYIKRLEEVIAVDSKMLDKQNALLAAYQQRVAVDDEILDAMHGIKHTPSDN